MEVLYQIVNSSVLKTYNLVNRCSKVAQKSKSCPKLLLLKKVARNTKSCSKIAEHNLDMRTPTSRPREKKSRHPQKAQALSRIGLNSGLTQPGLLESRR